MLHSGYLISMEESIIMSMKKKKSPKDNPKFGEKMSILLEANMQSPCLRREHTHRRTGKEF